MFKPTIIATAMIVLAGSSIVLAQQNSGTGNANSDLRGQRSEHRYRPSTADMSAFTDASIAALRAGLELTPDQAKNWPEFEQSLRDAAQLLIQAREAQRQERQTPEQGQAPANPFPRLKQRADNLAKVSAALTKVADTGNPLYQSLTDEQKQRFTILVRTLRLHWIRMAVGAVGNRMMGHGMMGGHSDQDSER
jgi:hypothetical protein